MNIPALTGNGSSFYPNFDFSDPIPAKNRGLYFTGNGSYLSFPNPSTKDYLLLGVRFFISFWINPVSAAASLFHKDYASSSIFSVSLRTLALTTTIQINSTIYSYTSQNSFNQEQWNYALISVDYAQGTTLVTNINTINSLSSIISPLPFLDIMNSKLLIGSSSDLANSFQGFIYSIQIYNFAPNIQNLASLNCFECSVCPSSGTCYSTCNITSYSWGSIQQCLNCSEECVSGCINNQTCSLCEDPNCYSCNSFQANSCTECNKNYELKAFSCYPCSTTTFYSLQSKTCISCPSLCTSCSSLTSCKSCKQNSFLDSGSLCVCNLGYSTNGTDCVRNKFQALITINSNNVATIIFTEFLSTNLSTSDIRVSINSAVQDYTLTWIDDETYKISLNTTNINDGDKLNVAFVRPLTSTLNSVLVTQLLSIDLFGTNNNIAREVSIANTYAKNIIRAGISATLGTSAASFNPSHFFAFLYVIEIYSYIAMYQVDIDPVLTAFLASLDVNSDIPSLFSFILSPSDGVQLSGKLNDFGYTTNLLLLNSGLNLTVFLIFCVCFVFFYFFPKINNTRIDKIIGWMLKQFMFAGFFRLWVETCLEIMFGSIVGIYYSELANKTQIIDYIICWIMIVTFI